MPLGKKSVSGAVSVAAASLGLCKVMVRVEAPPILMVPGKKDLARSAGRSKQPSRSRWLSRCCFPGWSVAHRYPAC